VNVSQDGRVVEGLSTYWRIGTGVDKDSLVTGVGGAVEVRFTSVSSGKLSENVDSKGKSSDVGTGLEEVSGGGRNSL
jgi:hypothetical protein